MIGRYRKSSAPSPAYQTNNRPNPKPLVSNRSVCNYSPHESHTTDPPHLPN
jgi:hypothetical protein